MKPIDQIDIFSGEAPAPVAAEQFRLTGFQVFNWGTFSDMVDIDVSPKGFLFVGPSGAGKSTLLDANSTLMTPPKWLGFNVAAREGEAAGNNDRNLMTYVRGAWGQQTGKSGEAVQMYLREGTTWSALAQTYTSTAGREVTIAQVFWVRGRTTDRKEIKRTYIVADRAFDLRELQLFASKDFDMKVLRSGQGLTCYDEFSGYRDRLSRLMGIEQESAFRLLHKTQSAKNLGDLNDFLRDFALEPPETFELAPKLVANFRELRDAHSSVVDSRRQIEVLAPAKEASIRFTAAKQLQDQLGQAKFAVEVFREQAKKGFLTDQVRSATAEIEHKAAGAVELRAKEDEIRQSLNILLGKRNGAGAAQIAQCEDVLRNAKNIVAGVESNLPLMDAVAELVVQVSPASEDEFFSLRDAARQYIADTQAREKDALGKRDKVQLDIHQNSVELRACQEDIASLAKRRSNMPTKLLEVRNLLCRELDIDEADLPFAGELVDVRSDQVAWKPAAERVMRNFAERLVVPEALFQRVSTYINNNHMGTAVNYFHAKHGSGHGAGRGDTSPRSLFAKLEFTDHPLSAWVAEKARHQFDLECVDSNQHLAAVRRGVTREGQVKTDDVSYRKDDRRSINDKSQWILGGDNRAKLDLRMQRAEELNRKQRDLRATLQEIEQQSNSGPAIRKCEKLLELDWSQLDLARAQRKVDTAQLNLEIAKEAIPEVDELDAQIEALTLEHTQVQKAASAMEAACEALTKQNVTNESRIGSLNSVLLDTVVPGEIAQEVQARFDLLPAKPNLDNLDRLASDVKDQIGKDERSVQSRVAEAQNTMLNHFRDYIREWPAKAANLDASVNSAEEFFVILGNLERDGLPQYEERFLQFLKEQSTRGLLTLANQLSKEHKAIKARLSDVNESLATAPFNRGTHLVIEAKDKQLPDVMQFRTDLRDASTNLLTDNDLAEAERRYGLLNSIVSKLESPEAAAKRWREVCLDVRQQVEFIIREVDDANNHEIEVYRSGAGKSGGQRQKLTATILAAALRYQLGGKNTGLPMFSTVFMDEAFDKADSEFTDMAINIFKTFGFQLVVATPLKSVMTLEPYIGGACFVHIENRKNSRIVPVTYVEGAKKLDFAGSGVDVSEHSQD